VARSLQILLDKDGKRVTSAHAYLNGYVKFSKEATFRPVKLPPMPGATVFPLNGVATRRSRSTSVSNQSTPERQEMMDEDWLAALDLRSEGRYIILATIVTSPEGSFRAATNLWSFSR
jgi:hypothetical protein